MDEKFVELFSNIGRVILCIGLSCILIAEPAFWDTTLPDIYRVVIGLSALWFAADCWKLLTK